jgi:hypothetical protein
MNALGRPTNEHGRAGNRRADERKGADGRANGREPTDRRTSELTEELKNARID